MIDPVKYFPTTALTFATEAHAGQVRKYTPLNSEPQPYIMHPIRVAGMVQSMGMVAIEAALLHDTIEDCGVTYGDLECEFGLEVANLVVELTHTSKRPSLMLNRVQRKEMDREHIAKASPLAKTIKICDRLDNLRDLNFAPKDWARMYILESFALLEALEGNDFPGMLAKLEKRLQELSQNPVIMGDE